MPHRTTPMPLIRPIDVTRFWNLVDMGDEHRCWPWIGYLLKAIRPGPGYGDCKVNGHKFRAHRVAYFLSTGRDPGPLLVTHSCDFKPCCNPYHLFAQTNADNLREAAERNLMGMKGDLHWSRANPAKVESMREVKRAIKLDTIEEIGLLYASGLYSLKAVAQLYSVSAVTIFRIVHGIYLERRKLSLKAGSSTVARTFLPDKRAVKLTREQVDKIRSMPISGLKDCASIAEQYGVGIYCIYKVARMKSHIYDRLPEM